MQPFVADPDFVLYVGDALETLRELPAESVHCCVTSPPYWGLRDYGTGTWEGGDPDCDHRHDTEHQKQGATSQRAGRANVADQRNENFRDVCPKCGATRVDQQLGLEPTPDEYVANMVAVFREVKRVLRHDGSLWLNLGDSYVSGQGGRQSAVGELPPSIRRDRPTPKARPELENSPSGWAERAVTPRTYPGRDSGLKPKDLYGMPWRVAFALQADGWYLRSDIIWAKPNPMPESVTDRPTKAHEYLFLLTKSARYFYDADAIREDFLMRPQNRFTDGRGEKSEGRPAHRRPPGATGFTDVPQDETLHESLPPESPRGADGRRKTVHDHATDASHSNYANIGNGNERWPNGGRNKRSVWEILTAPYPEAHFAVFPEALIEPCIKAGCPEWVCSECGKPRERLTEVERSFASGSGRSGRIPTGKSPSGVQGGGATVDVRMGPVRSVETVGWSDCGCDAEFVAGVCLDPFSGSGTTALVARRLGRRSIGIELSPEYAEMAARRLGQQSLFAEETA